MNEHSEQPSTNTLENSPFAVGGLVIVMCFAAPILLIVGVAKALSLLAGSKTTNK